MTEHLPILQIVVPLMAAPVCILLRRRALTLGFAIAVCWAVFANAGLLLARALEEGPFSYYLGAWAPPWGIEYHVDVLSGFVLFFVSGIGAVVLLYAPTSIAREIPEEKHYLFCAAYLLCLTGLMGIAITGDLFNVFVFLEISSLSSYALISLGQRRQALTATFQYLVLGTIGATFILIGIGLLYMMTGTLNMADLTVQLGGVIETRTVRVAAAFLTVGLCIKMALFPLHIWLPNAYTYAPSVVSAFLAATATKVSVYLLIRTAFTVFQARVEAPVFPILAALAVLAMFVASTVAIFQSNLKRLLAYSSLAQIGYMVLGVSLASVTGLTAAIVHLFNHALIKGGMFLALGCIMLRVGSVRLEHLHGIGRRMPYTTFAFVLGGLGLIGVPATAGFVSKWYLILAALEQGLWPIAVLVLLSSLLAVVYVWRVVEVAYFRPVPADAPEVREAPLAMLIPTYVLVGGTLFFGLQASLSAGAARDAASAILGVLS